MSIFFNIGRNPNPDYVSLDPQFITIKNLKSLISSKIGVKEQDMRIKNVLTSVQYALNQYIRKGSSVNIEITAKNLVNQPLKFHQIITDEHLEALMTDCRFYMIKSSNQDNIQKARECSVWATTFLNQEKFRNAFQCYKHVFFLFGTNRSFELKGLARMEGEPEKMPDKTIWNGVGNIRLGGNFKIRWIRKKPLSLTTIERKLGVDARDEIAKATDGYEPDKEIAKKVSMLFELPSEPYYKLEDLLEEKRVLKPEMKTTFLTRPNNLMVSQLASVMMKNISDNPGKVFVETVVDQLGIFEEVPPPVPVRLAPPEKERKSESRESSPSPRRSKKKSKKDKKSKKSKKKKHKKESKKKRYESSSSSSRSRSRSSSSSYQKPRKRRQKHKRTQKRRH